MTVSLIGEGFAAVAGVRIAGATPRGAGRTEPVGEGSGGRRAPRSAAPAAPAPRDLFELTDLLLIEHRRPASLPTWPQIGDPILIGELHLVWRASSRVADVAE